MRLIMGDMVLEGTPVEIAAAVERIEAARSQRERPLAEELVRLRERLERLERKLEQVEWRPSPPPNPFNREDPWVKWYMYGGGTSRTCHA